ncbi:MAG: aldehyde:ferredoxin oxidoreductase [Nanoarchaeota archaeon]|nr:aldehyde:ferredoxin oxidoreductase [Nanoarchaeota archaeon]
MKCKTTDEFSVSVTRHEWDIEKLKAAHSIIAEHHYEKREIIRGYAGRTLHIDLEKNSITEKPLTEEMKDKFTGGRGFGLKLIWDGINKDTRWDSAENMLVITNGVMCGQTQYSGSGKSLCLTISPSTDIICDSNVGGYFGPFLKFAGFDALALQGKAKEDVVVVIDADSSTVRIETAPLEEINTHYATMQFTKMYSISDKAEDMQKVSVVSSGVGSEHSYWGIMNFSFFDIRRKVPRVKQAGRGGLGTVFRDKKIKALVAITDAIDGLKNNPADPDKLAEVGIKHHREIAVHDKSQNTMRLNGTPILVHIMNDYDLLPVENYRFGRSPKANALHRDKLVERYTQVIPDGCWFGCTLACAKAVDDFTVLTGPYKGEKVSVDGPEYETIGACTNMGIYDLDSVLEFNFYCDTYGLDTISAGTAIAFYMEMFEYGILNRERCGGLDLYFGNKDALFEFLHRIAAGDNSEFIQTAAKGIRRVKDWLIKKNWGEKKLVEDCGMENKGLEYSEYVTKESLAQQGGYGLTNKGPQHDEAWLIFMDMVNNSLPTFKDKAEALHYFPIWRTWFGLAGFCKLPWNDIVPPDNKTTNDPNKVPEHVDNYVEMFNAMTGRELTKEDILLQSERCYNFQRAMNVFMGRGTRKDDWVPYRSMGPVTEKEYLSRQERYDKELAVKLGIDKEKTLTMETKEKMALLYDFRRNQYEKLTDAVYFRRGWTQNGIPTVRKMKALGMDDEKMLPVLAAKIVQDEKDGLNEWGGKYSDGEERPSEERRYWEKW